MDLDSLKYLIEALRTPAAQASVTPQTGPNAGVSRPSGNSSLGPIEQRRDGYRQYLNEFRAGSQEGDPLSYNEWLMQEK